MNTVFKRVATWNAARYERVHNTCLTCDLLTEEIGEVINAESPVDELDGLCDITYVALGALWKLGVEAVPNKGDELVLLAFEKAAKRTRLAIDNAQLHPFSFIIAMIMQINNGAEEDEVEAIYCIVLAAYLAMVARFNFTHEDCVRALSIVCDSNDSKTAVKTASDVKANIDKGAGFIAPESRLQQLIDEVNRRGAH